VRLRNSGEFTAQITLNFAWMSRRYLYAWFVQGSVMKFTTSNKVVIDEIVAACDGDIRRALEVLFLLESEIQKLTAALSSAKREHSSPWRYKPERRPQTSQTSSLNTADLVLRTAERAWSRACGGAARTTGTWRGRACYPWVRLPIPAASGASKGRRENSRGNRLQTIRALDCAR
jgi:hypothetical protein